MLILNRFGELSPRKQPQKQRDGWNVNAHKSFPSQFWWERDKLWIIRQDVFILINSWEMNRDVADGWVRTEQKKTKDWGNRGFIHTRTERLNEYTLTYVPRPHIQFAHAAILQFFITYMHEPAGVCFCWCLHVRSWRESCWRRPAEEPLRAPSHTASLYGVMCTVITYGKLHIRSCSEQEQTHLLFSFLMFANNRTNPEKRRTIVSQILLNVFTAFGSVVVETICLLC